MALASIWVVMLSSVNFTLYNCLYPLLWSTLSSSFNPVCPIVILFLMKSSYLLFNNSWGFEGYLEGYNNGLIEWCIHCWPSSGSSCFQINYTIDLDKFENSIHKVHKSHWGIGQPIKHHCKFLSSTSTSKCDFRNVFRLNFKSRIIRP